MNPLRYFLFLTLLIGLMASCERDSLHDSAIPSEVVTMSKAKSSERKLKESLRLEIQKTLSEAMTNKIIRYGLMEEVARLRTGDFEILLSEFMSLKTESGTTYIDLISRYSKRTDFKQVLLDVIQQRPSLLIAYRGNTGIWVDENFIPPVCVEPRGFTEDAKTVVGHLSGQEEKINLKDFDNTAFVAIHLSERHDVDGVPLYLSQNLPVESHVQNVNVAVATIDASDFTGTSTGNGTVVMVGEPTACPEGVTLNSFSATEQNGGILVSYNISGYNPAIGNWLRVKIRRLGVNNDERVFLRSAVDPPAFIDNDLPLGLNLTFTYIIETYIAYIDNDSGEWVTCNIANSPMTSSATVTTNGGRVTSFVGTNLTNQQIRYNWLDPDGVTATEYRLQVYNNNSNSYQTVVQQPVSANNSFTYNYPSEMRDNIVQMQIQYRANNQSLWRGDFYDQTYGSFRNTNEAVKYYGIWMPNFDDFEGVNASESMFYGGPEIRLLALKATSPNETDLPSILQRTILFTRNCCYEPYTGSGIYALLNWYLEAIDCIENNGSQSNFYVPLDAYGVNGFTILPSWQNDFAGSYIRLYTQETDNTEIIITSSTEVTEESLSANIGFKLPDSLLGVTFGLTAGIKTTETINYRYPTSDIPLNNFVLSYFEPQLRRSGNEVFGRFTPSEAANSCQVLSASFE